MKRNGQKVSNTANGNDTGVDVADAPNQNGDATSTKLARSTQRRPEVAVLGWDARFYRLSLRDNKA